MELAFAAFKLVERKPNPVGCVDCAVLAVAENALTEAAGLVPNPPKPNPVCPVEADEGVWEAPNVKPLELVVVGFIPPNENPVEDGCDILFVPNAGVPEDAAPKRPEPPRVIPDAAAILSFLSLT